MPRLVADRVFLASWCIITHNSLQAYMSLRRYTAASSIPPAWRQ